MRKSVLYVFNPEHDLALASGEMNYMAPASARRMAAELALLPIWYAEEESGVLAASAYNMSFLKEMKELLGVSTLLVTEPELAAADVTSICSWGWDVALRKRLLKLGIQEGVLPADEELNMLRLHAHRSVSAKMLSRVQLGSYFCGESVYLTSPLAWSSFVESHNVCLLKAPLSGSGKGLNWCTGGYTAAVSGWCSRIGEQQGGVIGEPIYDKVEDFALEFYLKKGHEIEFVGYSLFQTGRGGAYESSSLLSDASIEELLSKYIPLEELHKLRVQLEEELLLHYGDSYYGYLGVDMMICRFPDFPIHRIHPCVEVNLRMNMGIVARRLYDRFIDAQSSGTFCIRFHPSEGEAWKEHEQQQRDFPLVIENGKVIKGYMPLVPVHKKSSYRAWALVENGL